MLTIVTIVLLAVIIVGAVLVHGVLRFRRATAEAITTLARAVVQTRQEAAALQALVESRAFITCSGSKH